jgi:hypothetical protein
MDILRNVLIVISGIFVGFGLISLVITWLAPGIADSQFFRRMLTGSRMAPTRSNKTLMALWSTVLGLYVLLSQTRHYTASYIAFAMWIPISYMVLRTPRSRPEG